MGMPYFGRPIPFDMPFVGQHGDEGVFTQEITSCAERLGASHKEKQAAQALSGKIKRKLDQLVTNPELLETLKIEDVYEVGSVKTDTALAGHCVADITIITSVLPFQEMMESLSTYLISSFGDECISCYPTEYGCLVTTTEAQARLLVTITPNNASELEPGLHLDADLMRVAYQAVRQTQYIEGLSHQPIPLKELIRVVKDVRRRFSGLHHLNIWVLQYLCYFSLMKEPERIPLPLGPAFRRFFQLLSAGIFLPNAAPMYDPAEPSRPLGSDLTFEQMDELCATAQTILRLICNKGQSIVLGVSRLGSGELSLCLFLSFCDSASLSLLRILDVTKQDTHLSNVVIRPSRPIYCEEDMKPKFCEEDLKLLSVRE